MKYRWANITARAFEQLVKKYLEDHYPNEEWVLLPSTGDGNRDVEATIQVPVFGVSIKNKLWVEAKHTKGGKRALSKGQLDPTIVSVLLDNSVIALMFVTNSRYPDAYIFRAQRVLKEKLPGGLYFIGKEELENWLDHKPLTASGFFSGIESTHHVTPKNGFIPTLVSATLVSLPDYLDGYFEARTALYQSEELILILVVNALLPLEITSELKASGLTLEPNAEFPSCFSIHAGRQIVPLRVFARQQRNNEKATISLLDKQKNCLCSIKFKYSIGPEPLTLDCSGQTNAAQLLHEVLRAHRDVPSPGCVSLIGPSGSGKSFVLEGVRKKLWLHAVYFHAFNEPTQNARALCYSLLFIAFGVAAQLDGLAEGGRVKPSGIPCDLIRQLQEGVNGNINAQEILEKLLFNNDLSKFFCMPSRGDAKVLVFDDIQKADSLSSRVLKKILELLDNGSSRTLVVLARHPNYLDLEDAIRPILIKDIHISPLTSTDIAEVLYKYIKPEAARLLLPEAYKIIKTVLELRHLASELRACTNLKDSPVEEVVFEIRKKIVLASIPEMANRIKDRNFEQAADLIVLLDDGVPEDFLVANFGINAVKALLDSKLFERARKRNNEPIRVVSAHDLLRAAYLARRKVYSDLLAKIVEKLLQEEPSRKSDILGHLCLCGEDWRSRYLSNALQLRDTLLAETRFGAARNLSHTLYALLSSEGVSKLAITPEEHLSIIYGYADCVNHMDGSGEALRYFNEVIDVGKLYSASASILSFVCQAKSELFNMKFWQHDLSNLQEKIEDFLKVYDNLPSELESQRVKNAKMTAINRLMMFSYLMDRPQKAEQAFLLGLDYSEKHGQLHDRANFIMDQAKSIMLSTPGESLKKMEEACYIYEKTNTQARRLSVCKAQIAYLRSMLEDQSYLMIENLATNLKQQGFIQEYDNCALQISALHLISGRYEEASDLLDFLSCQPLKNAPRRLMLYYHLRGILIAVSKGAKAAQFYLKKHVDMTKNLGGAYQKIALHNISLPSNVGSVEWAFGLNKSSYWIDPRLW